jgi:hypothetical protein
VLKAHRSGTPIRDQGSDRDHVITISCGTGWSEMEWLSQPHFNLFTASACLLLDRGEHVRRPEVGLGPNSSYLQVAHRSKPRPMALISNKCLYFMPHPHGPRRLPTIFRIHWPLFLLRGWLRCGWDCAAQTEPDVCSVSIFNAEENMH